jgi:uncharacterized protein YjbJ (UPF0337 family)
MNKDQVKGRVDATKGKAKELAGKATGNGSLEAEGKLEKVGGKTRATLGDAKEKLKDSARR